MNDIKSTDDTSSEETIDTSAQSAEQQTVDDGILNFIEIIFSAPFRTEAMIDSKKILGRHEKFSKKVQEKLSCTSSFSGWRFDPHIDKKSKNFGIISPDKPGLTTLPPYFLGYKILAEGMRNKEGFEHLQEKIICELNCRIDKINYNSNEKKKLYFSHDNFQIIKAKLKFFEFGFGSIVIYGRLIVKDISKKNIKLLKFAIESDEIKSILNDFISEYIDEYEENISEKICFYQKNLDQKYLIEPRKVYWTHRLVSFVLNSKKLSDNDEDNSEDEVKKLYDKASGLLTKYITINENEEVTQKELNDKNQIFIPGTGNSFLLTKSNREDKNEKNAKKQIEIETDSVSDMIAIAGVYSAFMHHFHGGLLFFVNKIMDESDKERDKKLSFLIKSGLFKLSKDVSNKLHTYFHINSLFLEYETLYLSSIGKGAFEKTKEVWKFDEQLIGVKHQIETLEKIYDRNDGIIDRKQRTTLNFIAVIFTITAGLLSLGNVSLFTIDRITFDNIFTILCLVALVYFAYKVGAFLFRKYIPKLYDGIISFCKKNLIKNGS